MASRYIARLARNTPVGAAARVAGIASTLAIIADVITAAELSLFKLFGLCIGDWLSFRRWSCGWGCHNEGGESSEEESRELHL